MGMVLSLMTCLHSRVTETRSDGRLPWKLSYPSLTSGGLPLDIVPLLTGQVEQRLVEELCGWHSQRPGDANHLVSRPLVITLLQGGDCGVALPETLCELVAVQVACD